MKTFVFKRSKEEEISESNESTTFSRSGQILPRINKKITMTLNRGKRARSDIRNKVADKLLYQINKPGLKFKNNLIRQERNAPPQIKLLETLNFGFGTKVQLHAPSTGKLPMQTHRIVSKSPTPKEAYKLTPRSHKRSKYSGFQFKNTNNPAFYKSKTGIREFSGPQMFHKEENASLSDFSHSFGMSQNSNKYSTPTLSKNNSWRKDLNSEGEPGTTRVNQKSKIVLTDFQNINIDGPIQKTQPSYRRTGRYKAVKKLKDYANTQGRVLKQNGRITICQKYK